MAVQQVNLAQRQFPPYLPVWGNKEFITAFS